MRVKFNKRVITIEYYLKGKHLHKETPKLERVKVHLIGA
jgi:hypothetical protein